MLRSDKDFARFTRRLLRAGQQSDAAAFDLFRAEQPVLEDQIRRDARRNGPLAFWGRSRNHDEFARQPIVDPLVLRLLERLTGRKLAAQTPHAGLQHCYGYLFSNLETPYGYKRQRWIETGLEDSLGLHPSTLSPTPNCGTLLANATLLSGRIAYRGHRLHQNRLASVLGKKASAELTELSLRGITHFRMSERVKKTWRKKQTAWTLQTDIIQAENGYAALVYSIRYDDDRHHLVTLFPVDQATSDEIRTRAESTGQTSIRTRYNAHVPGLAGESLNGRISLREF
ncbi:MAG: hypothetical protein AAFU85_05935 [Planctomycetota bacterium]